MPLRATGREADPRTSSEASLTRRQESRKTGERADAVPGLVVERDEATILGSTQEPGKTAPRTWPRRDGHEVESAQHFLDRPEQRQTLGWEP